MARSPANRPCGGKNTQDPYEVEFFRKGETTPFEKRAATGNYVDSNATEYFTVSEMESSAADRQQRFAQMMQKMSDPNLSDAAREKLVVEIQKAQQEMIASMPKMNSMEDAMRAARETEAKRKAFGCERIEVTLQGANATGNMRCSETIGTRIALTGTMRTLGQ